jgi:hypothetical protein
MMTTESLRAAVYDKCRRHVLQSVGNAELSIVPFPHVLIGKFFPDAVYEEILANLPPDATYDPFNYRKHGRSNGSMTRFRFVLTRPYLSRVSDRLQQFWLGVRDTLACRDVKRAVFRKLAAGLTFRYSVPESQAPDLPGYPELFLVRETAGYRIAPHPDTRRKVVTMQIALPANDAQRDLGTEFYRLSMNPLALAREPHGFEIVKRSPFLPNAAYAFSVLNTLTWKSWHGRTTLAANSGVRNSLLNIWYEKPEFGNPEVVVEHYHSRRAAA